MKYIEIDVKTGKDMHITRIFNLNFIRVIGRRPNGGCAIDVKGLDSFVYTTEDYESLSNRINNDIFNAPMPEEFWTNGNSKEV